jgi:FSR family fosmidomycin resistance protein-like MFS transporter
MRNRFIWLAALGHLFTDLNQGAVPALLPFFISEYQLSYASAAGLVAALSIASTVIQPLFGFYADRLSKPWLIPAGVGMAGCGVAFCTLLPYYWFAIAMIVLSGIGIAAFHPEGARLVHNHAGEKKATAMSVFAVGGQMGIALGPIMATVAVSAWGLRGTAFLAIPFVLMAAFLAFQLTGTGGGPGAAKTAAGTQAGETAKDLWGPFTIVTGVVIIRSIIFYGLNTFIPLYWINNYQQSATVAASDLSIMFGAGVVGTLWGGRLADKYGHRKAVLVGYSALIPLLILFVQVKDVMVATALLVPIGIVLLSTYSPLVVMGQRFLPNQVGLASGITLGVAISIGGIVAPLLGHVADGYGLPAALTVLTFLTVPAVLLTLMLPRPQATKEKKLGS